jgi:MFS superfamily sulfate permease-like transporter
MSDNSSIYSDSYSNFNDGHVLNYEKMSNKEILNKLDETLDRLLFVVGCICLFLQNMWRNLYFFKYPRLAFLVLAFAFLYADMNNLITFLVVLLCMAILYNHHSIHAIVNELSNKFLTGKQYIHPDFK